MTFFLRKSFIFGYEVVLLLDSGQTLDILFEVFQFDMGQAVGKLLGVS